MPSESSSSSFVVRWQQSPDDSCVWFDFGDGIVVHHRPSGKTHLLNDASFLLLTEILEEPQDLYSIAAEFETGESGSPRQAVLDSLADMLCRLEQYGLIERV